MSLNTKAVINSINITLSHKYRCLESNENIMLVEERENGQKYKIEITEVENNEKA